MMLNGVYIKAFCSGVNEMITIYKEHILAIEREYLKDRSLTVLSLQQKFGIYFQMFPALLNLMFEVEDQGTSYNPEAIMIAIWEYAVPSDRAAEHRTERAAGKVWAVGMNNECFVVGTVTLGIRCSAAAPVSFKVKVVVVQASIVPSTTGTTDKALQGEVRANMPAP